MEITDDQRNAVGKKRLAKVTKGCKYIFAGSQEGQAVPDEDREFVELMAYGLLLVWDGFNDEGSG